MDAAHTDTFDEIAQTKKEEERAAKEGKWDGKVREKVERKAVEKARDLCTAHAGIAEAHTLRRNVQKGKAKGLAKKARCEVLMNTGLQQTLG